MLVDRAGNTFRSSKNLGLLSTSKVFRDVVGNGDRSDIYRFQLNHSSNVNIQLARLEANANITLFNNRGKVVARSTRPGKRAELIQQPLTTGVHYVRVTPRSRRDNTRYVLSLTATPVSNPLVPPTPVPTPTPISPFNIQFDYRFDTTGWFTAERRQALEASASIWENLILDEFPDTPVGTLVRRFTNPQTGLNVDNFANDRVIDDVLIFVGARELGGIVGATLALSGPALVTSGTPRYTSGDFEPWIGTMAFDRTTNWFFDPTPETSNDIPSDRIDFLSIATHEIAHVLGFGTSDAFDAKVSEFTFTGANARFRNGGNGIPLNNDRAHVQQGYQFGGSGTAIMSPRFSRGERRLPNSFDLAILDDIGYVVNYSGSSQNRQMSQTRRSSQNDAAQAMQQTPLARNPLASWNRNLLAQSRVAAQRRSPTSPYSYSYCGCVGCVMF